MDQNTELKEADFLKLFLKHENALRVFARSILPSWRNVDDVLQEASIVMWEKLDQLDGEEGFFPWGKTIIRFKCMNLMQKKKNERLVFSETLVNLLADDAEKIDEQEYTWRQNAIGQCLKKLSEQDQQLVMAPYLNHGSVKVLATTQSVSVNSLYKKLGRLRDLLFKCVNSQKALQS
jgi:RNA polymerase sigma-70 factor, ECF subfamily